MESLKLEELKVEFIKLDSTPLEKLFKAISYGLADHYCEVNVDIVDCPDLTRPPFNLAAKGLGGNTSVVQVGHVSHVIPTTLKHKIYNFKDVSRALNMKSAFIVGAGGGIWTPGGHASEMFMNIAVTETGVRNLSKYAITKNKTTSGLTVETADGNDSVFMGVGNLFVSEGEAGKVIKVSCKGRIKETDFLPAIIASMKKAFDHPVAVGIVFRMLSGEARHHVLPDFAKDINTNEEMNEWFLLPCIKAPFTSVGTLLTKNPPGWNITIQHVHSCNEYIGGHYRTDTTPEEVEYEAYIAPAERLCSIDNVSQPTKYIF